MVRCHSLFDDEPSAEIFDSLVGDFSCACSSEQANRLISQHLQVLHPLGS